MFIAKIVLGRSDYSKTRIQTPGGYELQVPFIKQKHANMCGDACVEMLSQFKGWGLNINMNVNPRGATQSLSGTAMLQNYGVRLVRANANSAAELEALLMRRGPVICGGIYAHMGLLGDRGHWVLLKGADANNFWVHDPWHGANVSIGKAQFFGGLLPNALHDPTLVVPN